MNENIEYEKFTQEIYQTLINAQGIKNISVQHNIKLTGKSKQKHQIDVYWEYEIAGIRNKIAIECKNYGKEVSIAKVKDFLAVLTDLNNVNGIIVTKVGYQKGAKNLADFYGINLKELRFPKDDDWEGRVKTVVFRMNVVSPNIKQRIPFFDNDWVKANIKLPENGQVDCVVQGATNEIIIYDETGKPITNFLELDQKIPHNWQSAVGLEHTYNFENAYLKVIPIGRIKILGVKYVYDIEIGTEEVKIDGEKFTKAILKDALTGEIKFFDKEGNIK